MILDVYQNLFCTCTVHQYTVEKKSTTGTSLDVPKKHNGEPGDDGCCSRDGGGKLEHGITRKLKITTIPVLTQKRD
jgi:hypothetical protein